MNDWPDLASGIWLLVVTLGGLLALGIWLSRRPNPADEMPAKVNALLAGRAPQRQRLLVATPPTPDAPPALPEPPQDTPTSEVHAELPSDPYQQWLESMQATWQATPAYLH